MKRLPFLRLSALFLSLLFALGLFAEGRARYVFYFIGDGMGVNQVNLTETFLAARNGCIGAQPLSFTAFPYSGLMTTYSASNGVTDSAAAGTALACGSKTRNGVLGLAPDLTTPLTSIAQRAQTAGAAVGITTSVSIDHATPAAFYAHQSSRSNYYEIGKQLIAAGYDFYAGGDFQAPQPKSAAKGAPTLYDEAKKAGYAVARGYAAYARDAASSARAILLQPEHPSHGDPTCLSYAIDRVATDLTLSDITRAAISHLTKAGKDGFFLMVEGGKIDYACHSNDAATVVREVLDMDIAVQQAVDFYRAHPDETLIVVTADHETGGIVLGRGPYELHSDRLAHQALSAERYCAHLDSLQRAAGAALTADLLREDLTAYWGFGKQIQLTPQQQARIEENIKQRLEGDGQQKATLYATINQLSDCAREIMAEQALIGWQSGGHSNGYVPVFALGCGAERFTGRLDNTRLPALIGEIAGW